MSELIQDLEKNKLIQYINLVFNNINNGVGIGPKSRELINITPSNKSFSIWGIIYTRLLLYVLTSDPCGTDSSNNQLFFDSVKYNSKWIENFTKSTSRSDPQFHMSLTNLKDLSKTLIQLIDLTTGYNKKTMKIYLTWVLVANALQTLNVFSEQTNLKQQKKKFISKVISGEVENLKARYTHIRTILNSSTNNGKILVSFYADTLNIVKNDGMNAPTVEELNQRYFLLFIITTLDNLVKNITDLFKNSNDEINAGVESAPSREFSSYIDEAVFDWAIDGLFTLEENSGSSLEIIYNSIENADSEPDLEAKALFKEIIMIIKNFFRNRIKKKEGEDEDVRVGEVNFAGDTALGEQTENFGLNPEAFRDVATDPTPPESSLGLYREDPKFNMDLTQRNITQYMLILQ